MQEYVSVRAEPPPSKRASKALRGLIFDEERCPEKSLALALFAAAAPDDVQGLLPQLSRDADPKVRLRTAGLLRKAAPPEAAALIRALAKDEDAKVRFAAAEALVDLGDAAAVPVLAALFGNKDKQQSYKAFHLARELESIEGMRERLVELLSSDDTEVVCRAAGILHYHRDKRGFEFLVRELNGNRHEAATALRWSVTPEDLPTLIPMMDDPDFDVRGVVVGLLLAFDDTRVLDWMLANFHSHDTLFNIRGRIIRYLSRYPNDEMLSLLTAQMARDRKMRNTAMQGFSRRPNRDALPFLRAWLDQAGGDSYIDLTGISRMGGREDVEVLLRCIERSKPGRQLFDWATRALRAITGEDLEGDAWRAWWHECGDTFDPIAARIKSLSGHAYRDSLFFLTHFGNDKSLDVMRAELSKRRDRSHEAIDFAKALALRGDQDGLAYLLSEGLDEDSPSRALEALHEATGMGARRSFYIMPKRWQRKKAQEWREYFIAGGELDPGWRRRVFAESWQRNVISLKLSPHNPELDAVLVRFAAVPAELRARLQESDGLFRQRATKEAGKTTAAWTVPILKAMLHDRDGGVRSSAAYALTRLDDLAVTDTMIELLSADRGNVRGYAAQWLGNHHIRKAIPRIIAAYEASPQNVQAGIAFGLAEMADDSLVDFFAGVLRSDQFNIRRAALKALSQMTPKVALPHLRKACSDESWFVWYEAVKMIYAMEGAYSYDWFLSCTKSPAPTLRAAGLFGVLHHKERPFPTELVWKILHDDDPIARMGAMRRMGEGSIIGKGRMPVLRSYLREEDNDPKMRAHAAEILAIDCDPLAMAETIRLLKIADGRHIWAAKRILERLRVNSRLHRRRTWVSLLTRILADKEMRVDALAMVVRLAGMTKDRELLRPIVQLLERGLDKLPTKRSYGGSHQQWSLLKDICSSLKEITGREFLDPEAVSSARSEIEKAIRDWWKRQPESVER
jgi:HEAT repeat protein